MRLIELYKSVQGESSFTGVPCIFVRFAGCNLRCAWCDTPHAFAQGRRMTRAAVLEAVLAVGCPLVELTGGEPLLQPEVPPLMTDLCDAGATVLLETSGAHDVGPVDRRVHVIMDLKCPDSGEAHRNRWANLAALKPTDQIKFVIASRRDWDWAAAAIRELRAPAPVVQHSDELGALLAAAAAAAGGGSPERAALRRMADGLNLPGFDADRLHAQTLDLARTLARIPTSELRPGSPVFATLVALYGALDAVLAGEA